MLLLPGACSRCCGCFALLSSSLRGAVLVGWGLLGCRAQEQAAAWRGTQGSRAKPDPGLLLSALPIGEILEIESHWQHSSVG